MSRRVEEQPEAHVEARIWGWKDIAKAMEGCSEKTAMRRARHPNRDKRLWVGYIAGRVWTTEAKIAACIAAISETADRRRERWRKRAA